MRTTMSNSSHQTMDYTKASLMMKSKEAEGEEDFFLHIIFSTRATGSTIILRQLITLKHKL